MKTIGVLGGMGPQATLDFEARVHSVSQRLIPQRANTGYPPLVVYYYRHAAEQLDDEGIPITPPQPDPRFLEAAKWLGSVSDFLAVVSNHALKFQADVERASGRKVLSMIDLTLAEIGDQQGESVGVLGNADLYQPGIEKLNITCETISGDLQLRLDEAIQSMDEGRAGPEGVRTAMEAVTELRSRNVDWIILGCTEIALLLGQETTAPDLINPTQLLAEAAVKQAIE